VEGSKERRGRRSWGGKAALAVGGMLVGGVLAGTLAASAAGNNVASQSGADGVPGYGAPSGGDGRHGGGPRGNVDESRSQRPDEHLLTGGTAAKVKAAALAKYPGRPCCGSRPTPTASTRPT
jgi:hypothetical protein